MCMYVCAYVCLQEDCTFIILVHTTESAAADMEVQDAIKVGSILFVPNQPTRQGYNIKLLQHCLSLFVWREIKPMVHINLTPTDVNASRDHHMTHQTESHENLCIK